MHVYIVYIACPLSITGNFWTLHCRPAVDWGLVVTGDIMGSLTATTINGGNVPAPQKPKTWTTSKLCGHAHTCACVLANFRIHLHVNGARALKSTSILFNALIKAPLVHSACVNRCNGHNLTFAFHYSLWWLFNTSTVLLPSVYLSENMGTHQDRFDRVYGGLREALRVNELFGDPYKPLVAYTKFRYGDTKEFYDTVRVLFHMT